MALTDLIPRLNFKQTSTQLLHTHAFAVLIPRQSEINATV